MQFCHRLYLPINFFNLSTTTLFFTFSVHQVVSNYFSPLSRFLSICLSPSISLCYLTLISLIFLSISSVSLFQQFSPFIYFPFSYFLSLLFVCLLGNYIGKLRSKDSQRTEYTLLNNHARPRYHSPSSTCTYHCRTLLLISSSFHCHLSVFFAARSRPLPSTSSRSSTRSRTWCRDACAWCCLKWTSRDCRSATRSAAKAAKRCVGRHFVCDVRFLSMFVECFLLCHCFRFRFSLPPITSASCPLDL
jgi:hypothetical protein